ncbi:MAG: nucleotidyltransferase domain-containing protein [Bacteroidota bacterium]
MGRIPNTLIEKYRNEITTICDRNHVKSFYFFGSVLDSNRFNQDSDIDVLVEFDEENISLETYTNRYFDLLFSLEDLLNRPIDITTVRSVKKPHFKDELESTKALFYESVNLDG